MNTTAEMKIEVSNSWGSNTKDNCILIEASKLSLKDAFMTHKPKTEAEKRFKATLTEVIKSGIEDFYRPVMDPSFADKKMTKIHYMAGENAAVCKSYNWWKETVKDSKYCLGTKAEYMAFLGVLIKMLVAKGWTVDDAWNAICNDSEKLGHYRYSENTKHQFEKTGSREICGFFDLANTYKILAEDKTAGGFWLAGGDYNSIGSGNPLADLELNHYYEDTHWSGVAWLVLKK